MNRIHTLFTCILLLASCSSQSRKETVQEKEDLYAKELLQGIWIDEMTESPILQIKGDTLCFINEPVSPVAFKIIDDSLKTYGQQTSSYHIEKQSESIFWIQSATGDIIQLYRAEESADSLFTPKEILPSVSESEVIEKDEVVFYNNIRYRGYVYINPTHIKVIQPELTEEGLHVENVFYDNIIHICVYEGKNKLFGKDIKKQYFEHLIPADYYQRAILSDMDFIGVNGEGYQYQATLCIPNHASCYLVHLSIHTDGEIFYELVL